MDASWALSTAGGLLSGGRQGGAAAWAEDGSALNLLVTSGAGGEGPGPGGVPAHGSQEAGGEHVEIAIGEHGDTDDGQDSEDDEGGSVDPPLAEEDGLGQLSVAGVGQDNDQQEERVFAELAEHEGGGATVADEVGELAGEDVDEHKHGGERDECAEFGER